MSIGHEHFIFGETPNFFAPFEKTDVRMHMAEPFGSALLTFKRNLASAFQVASIPYQLVHVAILNQHLQQIRTAESIRKLHIVAENDEQLQELQKEISSNVRARFDNELRDKKILDKYAEDTLKTLESHLDDGSFKASADELRLQVLVMSWGAFEAFFSDLIRGLLNSKPNLMRELMSVKEYRDLVLGRSFIDTLATHNFNLSGRMGDIFCNAVKMDGLEAIKTVADKVFVSSEASKALKKTEIWMIAQQRHLIVHRRAVIDASYLERTTNQASIGERLTLPADYIEEAMATLRDVGLCCFRAAAET